MYDCSTNHNSRVLNTSKIQVRQNSAPRLPEKNSLLPKVFDSSLYFYSICDKQIKQISDQLDAKIEQHLRELREHFDVKTEQQSAVINAKIKEPCDKNGKHCVEHL
ncbi:hypothetical protein HELRODRAFT_172716 [Helobdella robusta]|uniref:Uncharacterized protein n=1 Tax=Helobdella robusta TaxID=6412 RepID=T1F5U4_HELRO|nr:hypothetical protein HELRODRAFT_172716 [Helobdella robusta]ESO04349.1 hypothetical protein HELRODRAFT_172716 [Helobdella robusta]